MVVQENIDLLPFNTFQISATARYLTVISSIQEAQSLFRSEFFRSNPYLILGGGSNMLLTRNFPGLVAKNEIKGINVIEEDDDQVILKVGSGENWHELVMYCVRRDYGGLENLSLIPGTVGAAPMQNIGAYGVEIKDVLTNVEAINIKTGDVDNFSNAKCEFG
jgi:UDP-N-acetylmuramate dehydrogenase